jgi:di/tricarboxylate transporter
MKMLLFADTFGNVFIAVAILIIAAMSVAFLRLTNHSPRGAVLLIGLALFVLAPMMPDNNDRLLRGVEGVIRFTGFVGIVIGIYGLVRKREAKQEA